MYILHNHTMSREGFDGKSPQVCETVLLVPKHHIDILTDLNQPPKNDNFNTAIKSGKNRDQGTDGKGRRKPGSPSCLHML